MTRGSDELELPIEPRRARVDLVGLRVAVARRPALHHVGDVHVGAGQVDSFDELCQQLARRGRRMARPSGLPAHPDPRRRTSGRHSDCRPRTPPACDFPRACTTRRSSTRRRPRRAWRPRSRPDASTATWIGTAGSATTFLPRDAVVDDASERNRGSRRRRHRRRRSAAGRCSPRPHRPKRRSRGRRRNGCARAGSPVRTRRARSAQGGNMPPCHTARRSRPRPGWYWRVPRTESRTGRAEHPRCRRTREHTAAVGDNVAHRVDDRERARRSRRRRARTRNPTPPGTAPVRPRHFPTVAFDPAPTRPCGSSSSRAATTAAWYPSSALGRARARVDEVEDARGRHDRHRSRGGRVALAALGEIAHHSVGRDQPEGTPAGEHDGIDASDGARGIEHIKLARRRRAAANLSRADRARRKRTTSPVRSVRRGLRDIGKLDIATSSRKVR